MSRRANGSGTLFRRNGMYYAKIEVGGEVQRMSLGTREREEARKRLNALAKGFDLSDDERLAALTVKLRPKVGRIALAAMWHGYETAPENLSQGAQERKSDKAVWDGFMRWLHGQDEPRRRTNCKAAHPAADCMDDISEGIAGEFLTWMKDTRSPNTANKYMRILKRIWKMNGMDPNVWSRFRKFKEDNARKQAFTREEAALILDKAEGELKTLMYVGYYTGLRMGDCQRLRYEDIDATAGFIRTHKTGRMVRLPMHPKLKEHIGKMKSFGYVMPELAKMPGWELSKKVQAHLRSCGIETGEKREGYKKECAVLGFHSFRATFITRLGEGGVPLPVVRDMVGHVSEEMTLRYFRRDDAMAEKAIKALD